jgi:hypothetical integral membrane protein (TIGR02206 family)
MPAPAPLLASWPAASPQHLGALALFAAITAVVVTLGRRWRGTPRADRLRHALGLFGVLAFTLSCVWYLMPERRGWSVSLPLQLCDLVGLIAPLAILTEQRTLRTLLHFWGFALCTQFFVTPVHEPGTPSFVVSWLLHASIVGLAIFDCTALGYRPTWKDLRGAVLIGLAYIAAIFGFDAATGFNYGYVGPSRPGTTTIVDSLGEWPLRALWIVAIAVAAMALVMVIGQTLRRLLAKSPSEPRAQARGQNH